MSHVAFKSQWVSLKNFLKQNMSMFCAIYYAEIIYVQPQFNHRHHNHRVQRLSHFSFFRVHVRSLKWFRRHSTHLLPWLGLHLANLWYYCFFHWFCVMLLLVSILNCMFVQLAYLFPSSTVLGGPWLPYKSTISLPIFRFLPIVSNSHILPHPATIFFSVSLSFSLFAVFFCSFGWSFIL